MRRSRILSACLIVIAAVFTAIWFWAGRPSPAEFIVTRRWIDSATGDIKSEVYVGNKRVRSEINQTGFSKRVRGFGLQSDSHEWHQIGEHSPLSSVRINFVYSSWDGLTKYVDEIIDIYELKDGRSRQLIVKYLDLLRQGDVIAARRQLDADLRALSDEKR